MTDLALPQPGPPVFFASPASARSWNMPPSESPRMDEPQQIAARKLEGWIAQVATGAAGEVNHDREGLESAVDGNGNEDLRAVQRRGNVRP